MYSIEKLDQDTTDCFYGIAMYKITFQFEKSIAVVTISCDLPSEEIFPQSQAFHLVSMSEGYSRLNSWLVQEPNAKNLVGELASFLDNAPRIFELLRAELVASLDSKHSLFDKEMHKASLLWQAFGFEYSREDTESCHLYNLNLEKEETDVLIERIASVIEPRFALVEKFFPQDIS